MSKCKNSMLFLGAKPDDSIKKSDTAASSDICRELIRAEVGQNPFISHSIEMNDLTHSVNFH